MSRALELAAAHRHEVWPNPLVGCVLVQGSRVIGEGAHEKYGHPHAEVMALKDAEKRAESVVGATVFITLEPCAHTGKTPPCARALTQAGVARVVYSVMDPNPLVNGQGEAMLKEAGVVVESGLLAQEAEALNRGFLKRQKTGLPWITLKTAQSLDGKLADAKGTSQWITNDASRQSVMALRHGHDAVLVGTGTLLNDAPRLTVRPPQGTPPVRIALDLHGRLVSRPALLDETPGRAWLVVAEDALSPAHKDFESAGGVLIVLAGPSDIETVFRRLAAEGLGSVLVEAGPTLATALLGSNLLDEWRLFVAPLLLGGAARYSVFAPENPPALAFAPRFKTVACYSHGDDLEWVLRSG